MLPESLCLLNEGCEELRGQMKLVESLDGKRVTVVVLIGVSQPSFPCQRGPSQCLARIEEASPLLVRSLRSKFGVDQVPVVCRRVDHIGVG